MFHRCSSTFSIKIIITHVRSKIIDLEDILIFHITKKSSLFFLLMIVLYTDIDVTKRKKQKIMSHQLIFDVL